MHPPSIDRATAWVEDRAQRLLEWGQRVRPRSSGSRAEPLRFMMTIDTEISMGGTLKDPSRSPVGPERRIWGRTTKGQAGIDEFMDIFDDYGFKGVFFFEVCAQHVVEPEPLAQAAAHIQERGHDVELHVHPEFRMDLDKVRAEKMSKPPPLLAQYDLEAQKEILAEACDTLESWTGRRPVAFRAGSYGGDERLVEAVAAAKMTIDSSYNLWSREEYICRFERYINDVTVWDNGIIEVPVTCYRAKGPRGGLRQLDLASMTAPEMIAVLEEMYAAGMHLACSVTHSFRLLKTYDIQYETAQPDVVNLLRLRQLCQYLDANRQRFAVCTYRDLPIDRWRATPPVGSRSPYIPSPPAVASLTRLVMQGVKDRGAV